MSRSDRKRKVLQGVFQDAAGKHWSETIPVRAVMTHSPMSVTPDHTAAKIVELFHAHGFRHFLVADAGRLVGVISDRDVIRLFGNNDSLEPAHLERVSVADLMSTDLVTISADATLADATTSIIEHGINCLPVVENGQAVGILTSTDLFLSLEQMLKAVARETAAAGV